MVDTQFTPTMDTLLKATLYINNFMAIPRDRKIKYSGLDSSMYCPKVICSIHHKYYFNLL
jgi:hypothetical protein